MTLKIDSEIELINFIQKLKIAGIEIPDNVTLEIDSSDLKKEINLLADNYLSIPLSENVNRYKYMGEKISFR